MQVVVPIGPMRRQRLNGCGSFCLCGSSLQKGLYSIGRLSVILNPVIDALVIQLDLGRRSYRVVMTHYFHRAAIPGALFFNNDHAIRGFLLGAKTRQPNC